MKNGATKLFSVISVALVVGVVIFGFVHFFGGDDLDPELKKAIEYANCDQAADQNLCRFLAVWGLGKSYTLNATENKNEQSTSYNLASSGEDFHLTVDGQQPRQTIAKDNKIYALIGDKWQEQTLAENDNKSSYRETAEFSFINLDNINNFSLGGEDQCLQAECLRYEVTNQDNSVTVWFDKNTYNLQRVLIRGDKEYSYNAVVDYGKTSDINAPNGATQVASGQHILPGGAQVSAAQTSNNGDLPATGDSGDPEEYEQWLKQRQ